MQISQTSRLRHDLRTHVNHILGYSQLLLEDAGEQPGNGVWVTSVRQVTGMAKDLLKTIERLLPAADTKMTEECTREVCAGMTETLRQMCRIIEEIPLAPESSQHADVDRMSQAARKLLAFVEAGSFESKATASGDRQPKGGLEAAHVLVVDGNSLSRDALSRMLLQSNFRVSFAVNGEDAIRLLGEQRYDVILVEVGQHGSLEKMWFQPAAPPTILFCGNADMEIVQHCIEMGAEDYVMKPLEPLSLIGRINAVFARRRRGGQVLAASRAIPSANSFRRPG